MLNVALVGFGYWGPNLARNFSSLPGCKLAYICEPREVRAQEAALLYPQAKVTPDYQKLLQDPEVGAILIATPVSSHYDLTKRALLAGKDVLVEKPLVADVAQGKELVDLADEKERIMAVDHTFLFTGAVMKMKELVEAGELGDLLYFDSVRINLGLFQPDVNVIYDLAPHDISILTHLYPQEPVAVQAMGARHPKHRQEHHAYLHLDYSGAFMAHLHLSWLAPVKVRRTLLGGSQKMMVYDDLEGSEKIKVYDKGVTITNGDLNSVYQVQVDYRTGDMLAPRIKHSEALRTEAEHFLDCVARRSRPLADGREGLRVVRILQASRISMQEEGRKVYLEELD